VQPHDAQAHDAVGASDEQMTAALRRLTEYFTDFSRARGRFEPK